MRMLLASLSIAGVALVSVTASAETPFTIMVGEPSWLPEAATLARAMDHEQGLRILPVLGHGSLQSMQDLQQFSGMNAALVSADTLAYAKMQNLLGTDNPKFSYVSAIKPLPVALIAKRSIANVTALAGKKIATGPADTASFAAGELLLGAMEVPFLRVASAQEGAIDALTQGKADAALVVGTPSNLDKLGNNYHVLTLVLPTDLESTYKKISLSAADVPGLITGNQQVDSVSTDLILAVNEANLSPDQGKALKTFENEFFRQSADSQNLLKQDVSGWTREANAASLVKSLPASITVTPTGATP